MTRDPIATRLNESLLRKMLAYCAASRRIRLLEPLAREENLGLDLKKFDLDELMVFWEIAEVCESLQSFLFAVFVHQPSWRERHEPDSNCEDDGGNALDDERYPPCPLRLSIEIAAH
jgi:hypothetical protein